MMSKKIIAACMLASSMATTVYAGDVACPAAADVKGSDRALNTVMRQSERSFFVLTGQPAINASGHSWLLVAQAEGNGFDAAYTSGVSEVKGVTMPVSQSAMEMQGMYVCPYFTASGGMGVMAVSPQQQGLTFDPSVLKLKALKPKK